MRSSPARPEWIAITSESEFTLYSRIHQLDVFVGILGMLTSWNSSYLAVIIFII
jgi:hypothetical protein